MHARTHARTHTHTHVFVHTCMCVLRIMIVRKDLHSSNSAMFLFWASYCCDYDVMCWGQKLKSVFTVKQNVKKQKKELPSLFLFLFGWGVGVQGGCLLLLSFWYSKILCWIFSFRAVVIFTVIHLAYRTHFVWFPECIERKTFQFCCGVLNILFYPW